MRSYEALLLGIVAVGALLSLWAGPNLSIAEPAAAVALAGAGAFALLTAFPRMRPLTDGSWETRADTLVLLSESFRQGAMGRQAILATLGGLESEVFGSRRAGLSLEEEERLKTVSARSFREWVDGRLSELERAS